MQENAYQIRVKYGNIVITINVYVYTVLTINVHSYIIITAYKVK